MLSFTPDATRPAFTALVTDEAWCQAFAAALTKCGISDAVAAPYDSITYKNCWIVTFTATPALNETCGRITDGWFGSTFTRYDAACALAYTAVWDNYGTDESCVHELARRIRAGEPLSQKEYPWERFPEAFLA